MTAMSQKGASLLLRPNWMKGSILVYFLLFLTSTSVVVATAAPPSRFVVDAVASPPGNGRPRTTLRSLTAVHLGEIDKGNILSRAVGQWMHGARMTVRSYPSMVWDALRVTLLVDGALFALLTFSVFLLPPAWEERLYTGLLKTLGWVIDVTLAPLLLCVKLGAPLYRRLYRFGLVRYRHVMHIKDILNEELAYRSLIRFLWTRAVVPGIAWLGGGGYSCRKSLNAGWVCVSTIMFGAMHWCVPPLGASPDITILLHRQKVETYMIENGWKRKETVWSRWMRFGKMKPAAPSRRIRILEKLKLASLRYQLLNEAIRIAPFLGAKRLLCPLYDECGLCGSMGAHMAWNFDSIKIAFVALFCVEAFRIVA